MFWMEELKCIVRAVRVKVYLNALIIFNVMILFKTLGFIDVILTLSVRVLKCAVVGSAGHESTFLFTAPSNICFE